MQFSVSNGASIAVDGMVEAVRQAVRATSKLAELKVTFNLGETLPCRLFFPIVLA